MKFPQRIGAFCNQNEKQSPSWVKDTCCPQHCPQQMLVFSSPSSLMQQGFKSHQHCRGSLLTKLYLKCTSKKVSAAAGVYTCVCEEQAPWVRTLLPEPADPVGRSHCNRIQSQILYCHSLSKHRTRLLRVFLASHVFTATAFIFSYFSSHCLFPLLNFFFLSSLKPLVLLQNKHVLF